MEDEAPKPNPQLPSARFTHGGAEQVRTVYAITVEPGVTKEQILHPDFYGGIAARLRPYDRIEVRCDDGSYFGELLVLSADRAFARVHLLSWHELTTKDVAQTQDAGTALYEVVHKGPHLQWCVVRKSDGALIRQEEKSKKAAQNYLDDYARTTTT